MAGNNIQYILLLLCYGDIMLLSSSLIEQLPFSDLSSDIYLGKIDQTEKDLLKECSHNVHFRPFPTCEDVYWE